MKIGFIGLGNVGGKLAGSLLRNGIDLAVHDLNGAFVADFVGRGARDGQSPADMMAQCALVITCLPSPAATRLLPVGAQRWIAPCRGAATARTPAIFRSLPGATARPLNGSCRC